MNIGRLIGVGATAEVFELNEDSVLKLYRKVMPKETAEWEYRIAKIISGCGVSSPKAIELTELNGRVGIVYERAAGKSMLKKLLIPWNTKKYAEMLAVLHHELHTKKPAGLPPFKKLLAEKIQIAALLSEEERREILKLLEKLPDGDTLCHGDFHPDNILISKGKPVILDWMTAGAGDPAADAARTSLILTTSELPNHIPKPVGKLVIHLRQALHRIYLKKYCEISGCTLSQIEAWKVPLAAARLTEWRPESENRLLLKLIRSKL